MIAIILIIVFIVLAIIFYAFVINKPIFWLDEKGDDETMPSVNIKPKNPLSQKSNQSENSSKIDTPK